MSILSIFCIICIIYWVQPQASPPVLGKSYPLCVEINIIVWLPSLLNTIQVTLWNEKKTYNSFTCVPSVSDAEYADKELLSLNYQYLKTMQF